MTLDETCEEESESVSNRYYNKCEKCDFTADGSKRYVALQLLKKHKETCKIVKSNTRQCCNCDFETNNILIMKRHTRDVHGIITGSTSPPSKKKKKSVDENVDENVDSQEPMDTSDVKDLSRSMEEMELEESEIEIMKERSTLKDKQIKKLRRKRKKLNTEQNC